MNVTVTPHPATGVTAYLVTVEGREGQCVVCVHGFEKTADALGKRIAQAVQAITEGK